MQWLLLQSNLANQALIWKDQEKYIPKKLMLDAAAAYDEGPIQHEKRLNGVILSHLEKASHDYHPLLVEHLDVNMFVKFLLARDSTKNEYHKSYGGFLSALTNLFAQMEYVSTLL
jgi:hypothetical protein